MSAPKSRHSDPRNTHIPSFVFSMPVLVRWTSGAIVVCSAKGFPSRYSVPGSKAQPYSPPSKINPPAMQM
jgi:hypothetical protein